MINFKHYNDFTDLDFKSDYHIHSTWTDGKNTINQIFQEMVRLKIYNFGISDHIRSTSTYFDNYFLEIETLRKKYNLKCLIGCEAKIISKNKLDISKKDFKKAEFVISSVHSLFREGKIYRPKDLGYEKCQETEYTMLKNFEPPKHINLFIGHIFGMTLKNYNKFDLNLFESIVKDFVYKNIYFEISYAYHANYINEIQFILQKYNPILIFNSDAHAIDKLVPWINHKLI